MRHWKSGITIIFILNCLLVVGCSKSEPQDENIDVIKTVLELDLNAPDEKAIRLFNEPYISIEAEEANEGFLQEYTNYIMETYGPYLTDSYFEQFVLTNQAFQFHNAQLLFYFTSFSTMQESPLYQTT